MTPPDEKDWEVYFRYPLEYNLYISEIQDRYGDTVAEKVKSSLTEKNDIINGIVMHFWKGPRAKWCSVGKEWVWPEANGMSRDEWDTQLNTRAEMMLSSALKNLINSKRKEDL